VYAQCICMKHSVTMFFAPQLSQPYSVVPFGPTWQPQDLFTGSQTPWYLVVAKRYKADEPSSDAESWLR
jgi:hypothetical protein